MKMDTLFDPGKIGTLSLANRFIRSATWTGLAEDGGQCSSRLIHLMSELAKGGAGLIITGHAFVHQNGRHSPWQLGIDRDELLPGLKKMTRAVHENETKIAVQLGYGGAYLSKARLRALSQADIKEIADTYGLAAARAKAADFDAVQIFAAHGFLLSQFLCPRYNDRTDMYGGDLKNRARAIMEVLESVRNAAGPDYPVLVKINASDFIKNGLVLEDAIRVGLMLEKKGIAAIELSGGLLNNPDILRTQIDSEADEAYLQKEARSFKEKLKVPIILGGGIRSFTVARQLFEHKVANYISMCRPFICEPDLINRWLAGDLTRSKCISCNNCVEEIKAGHGLSCIPKAPFKAATFFPQFTEIVPASLPHPPGTYYRVSVGLEQIDSEFYQVVKVEMELSGKVLEQVPFFPLGSNDQKRVNETIGKLLAKRSETVN